MAKTDFLKTRQTKFTAYATLYILIVLAALVLVNWLANRHNKSVDTTSSKQYSLSDQTDKVVKGLKQDVHIIYFTNRPEQDFTSARDLLGRYDTLSTKLDVEYIDMDRKPMLARQEGATQPGTIVVKTPTKKEQAKSLTEEDVTGAIIRATKTGERNVCVVKGSGEHAIDDTGRSGLSAAKELIERNNYQIRSISLLDKPEVPKDCTIVVVAGPKFDYTEPVITALKNYVEGGGHALFMVDPSIKVGNEPAAENEALVKLLAGWGVTLHADLVRDLNGLVNFGTAEIAIVPDYGSHAIGRPMKGVYTAFPLTRTVDAKSAGNASVEVLFSTGENAAAIPTTKQGSEQKKGPLPIAAAGTINGGPNKQGRFVVVGSSEWAANGVLPARTIGNRDLLMNMLNWLSADEDLISIRPKDPQDRRLNMTLKQADRNVFFSSVIFLPLIVLAAGIGVWWRRR